MRICSHNLNKKILIIAEIGNNHEGSLSLAKKLVYLAAKSGADAVKFQTYKPDFYVSKVIDPERFKMLSKFYLSNDKFKILKDYSNQLGLIFISTPFDLNSAKFLNKIVKVFKISSSDINFFPLLEFVSKTKKPILLSTGIADISNIKKSLNFIKRFRSLDKVILMHCVSSYPTLPKQANLNNINKLNKLVNYIGYSDHTIGIDASLCSVSMGVKVIERHFTIDNNYSKFRDHKISSNPSEFRELVNKVRLYETLLGEKNFKISKNINLKSISRSIAINCDLKAGSLIKKQHITWVRPGYGFSPGHENKFIGKKTKLSLKKGSLLKISDILSK